jgi:Ca2+-binding EF-hand superfamily protein
MVFRFIPEILFKISDAIKAKGPHAVRVLTLAFAAADPEFTGKLSREQWLECFDSAGVFLGIREIERLTTEFDHQYPEMLNMLSSGTLATPTREALVTALFQSLAGEDGTVPLEKVFSSFDASQHPSVKFSAVPEEEVAKKMMLAFEGYPEPMEADSFADAWRGIAACYPLGSDAEFVEMFKTCFGITLPPPGPKDDAVIDRAENVLRSKIIHKTNLQVTERASLLSMFKYVDPENKGYITPAQFSAAIERLGVWLPEQECLGFFERYASDVGGELLLDYAAFVPKFISKEMYHHALNQEMSDNIASQRLDFGGAL